MRVAPRDDPRDAVVERFAHEVVDLTFETIGGGEFTYRPHACDLVLLCGQSSDIQPETDRTATAAIFARALTGFRVSAL